MLVTVGPGVVNVVVGPATVTVGPEMVVVVVGPVVVLTTVEVVVTGIVEASVCVMVSSSVVVVVVVTVDIIVWVRVSEEEVPVELEEVEDDSLAALEDAGDAPTAPIKSKLVQSTCMHLNPKTDSIIVGME